MPIWPLANFVILATSASTYSANPGDFVIAPAGLGQACTVTLPPVSQGIQVGVKNLSTNPYTVTILANVLIDGIATDTGVLLDDEYDTIVLASDGVNWYSTSYNSDSADPG